MWYSDPQLITREAHVDRVLLVVPTVREAVSAGFTVVVN